MLVFYTVALHFLLFPYFASLFLLLEQIMEKCITQNNHRTLGSCIKGLCFNIGSFVGGLKSNFILLLYHFQKKSQVHFIKENHLCYRTGLVYFPWGSIFQKNSYITKIRMSFERVEKDLKSYQWFISNHEAWKLK